MRYLTAIFLFHFIFGFAGCGKTENKTDTPIKENSQETTNNMNSNTVYHFDSDTCAVYGLLNRETFYGPPGYGKDIQKDSKEYSYIFTLDKAIDLVPLPKDNIKNKEPLRGVTRVQLISSNDDINRFLENRIGERIMLRGVFSASDSGKHEKVIMKVLEYKYLR